MHDEEKCRYLVIYNKNHLCIGGARLLKLDANTMRIQRVAIAKPYRGNGIGHKLLSELEQACFRSKCQRIEIVARYTAQDFYASLGYQPENSDTFIRSGVPHQLFYKELN
ncbi:MAG: GNAT family N-acetyltransferase [Companilactobacillus sp.]|nr:GNAT family N-acetyltransferase [Companilactobacillus sp.]MCH4148983.1 GNAT family N-acetyltransferase [Companilactobacillus sp.]MCI1408748.1 GNAT family N-acetyltransferase [Companilactobacillus sp.]MCI1487198.1 GNAT family N-acetyltransferase [Companilactobacillus sp.]MCI1561659.1 GNAT family N-acetyltransferase [Companilactobacillus sp.]